VFRMPDN